MKFEKSGYCTGTIFFQRFGYLEKTTKLFRKKSTSMYCVQKREIKREERDFNGDQTKSTF